MKNVKGYVAQAGANKYGYYEISVGLGNKQFEKVSFGIKATSHALEGVTIAKGMDFDGVVDETQHNKFVSGTVSVKEKSQSGGKVGWGDSKGKSGGYDTVGQAMGGATNRVAQMVATKVIKPKDAGPAVLAQYMLSELCIDAAKNGKFKEARVALTDVDVNDYDAMAAAYKAYKAAVGTTSTPSTTEAQKAPESRASTSGTPVEPKPEAPKETPKQEIPEGFMESDDGSNDLPF